MVQRSPPEWRGDNTIAQSTCEFDRGVGPLVQGPHRRAEASKIAQHQIIVSRSPDRLPACTGTANIFEVRLLLAAGHVIIGRFRGGFQGRPSAITSFIFRAIARCRGAPARLRWRAPCKVRVLQLREGVEHPLSLLLDLHKAKLAVVIDGNLDRQLLLAPVAGEEVNGAACETIVISPG
jgi:hypothetical protein